MRASIPAAEGEAAWLDATRAALARAVTPEALASYRYARAAYAPARPRFDFPGLGRLPTAQWTGATELRLASHRAVPLRHAEDGGFRAVVLGREWRCSFAVAAVLTQLDPAHAQRLDMLAQGLDESDARELRRLLALLFASGALQADLL